MDSEESGEDRSWNEEFQELLQQVCEDVDEELHRAMRLKEFSAEFVVEATRIGKIIISEMFLPLEKKSIRPVTQQVGGYAGGEKFVQNGLFFKFAVDNKGIYGGDEFAMKIGGHEFKSFMEYVRIKHFLLDNPKVKFFGRWIAELMVLTELPINKSTLIYGSADGGVTIRATNKEMNVRMKLAAKLLNIAGHYVWDRDGKNQVKLHGPLDCEGHLGTDGRFYVLDPARLFPPEPPASSSAKGSRLYKLLRPELVKKSPVPLCSDAFSNFSVQNKEAYEADIVSIFKTLTDRIIPDFAKSLAAKVASWPTEREIKVEDFRTVEFEAHQRGINIRHLALVRQALPEGSDVRSYSLLLTLLIGRVLKNLIRSHMRALKSSQEVTYIKLVATYFTIIFGPGEKSMEFWKLHLKDRAVKTYSNLLFPHELAQSYNLRDSIDIIPLYSWIQELIGVKLKLSVEEAFQVNSSKQFYLRRSMSDADIVELYPIVKYTNRLAFEQGTAFSRKALRGGAGHSDEYFKLAEASFKAALQIKPDDIRALNNWSLSLMHQAAKLQGNDAARLYDLAIDKLQQAIKLNPMDARSNLLWGNCLLQRGLSTTDLRCRQALLAEACDKFRTANSIDPNNFDTLYNWGNALLHRSSLETGVLTLLRDAVAKLKVAVSIRPKNANALLNLAVTLAKYARAVYNSNPSDLSAPDAIYKDAGEKFEMCIVLRPDDREAYFNWGNAIYRQAKMHADHKQYQSAFQLCNQAAEKYISALDLKFNYFEALYNWANTLRLQSDLPLDCWTTEFSFAVTYFLEVFRMASIKHADIVSVEPLLALMQSHRIDLRAKTFSLLNHLSNYGQGALKAHATRALQELTRSDAEQLMQLMDEHTFQLPEVASTIVQTIGSGALERRSAEDNFVRKDDFKITSELRCDIELLHNSGFKLYRCMNVNTLQQYTMLVVDNQSFTNRIGENQHEWGFDETETARREYIRLLKEARPFCATAERVYLMEDDEWCILYRLSCSPQTASLYTAVKTNPTIETIRFYSAELLIALEALHNAGLFYGPLDARDVLLDRSGHLVLHQIPFYHTALPSAGEFQPEYLPPELLVGQDFYNSRSDWYSYGILLTQLVTQESPMRTSSFEEVYKNSVQKKDYVPSTVPSELASLISALLEPYPSKRLASANEIKKHPFFSGIKWTDVIIKSHVPPFMPQVEPFEALASGIAPTVVATPMAAQYRGSTIAKPT